MFPTSGGLDPTELTARMQIYYPSATVNPDGSPENTLGAQFADVWAKVESFTARETWANQQLNCLTDFRVTLHWLKGVTSRMRIVWDDSPDRYLEILGVRHDEVRHMTTVLICREING